MYNWKPNKKQRAAFAEKMQNPVEKAEYEAKKAKKKLYDNWKDKDFIPTKEQHDFVLSHIDLFVTPEEIEAVNIVMSGYACNERVNHSYIHVINQKRRNS